MLAHGPPLGVDRGLVIMLHVNLEGRVLLTYLGRLGQQSDKSVCLQLRLRVSVTRLSLDSQMTDLTLLSRDYFRVCLSL